MSLKAVIIEVGKGIKNEGKWLRDALLTYFVEIYPLWDDVLLLPNTSRTAFEFTKIFGRLPDSLGRSPYVGYHPIFGPGYRGKEIDVNFKLMRKESRKLEKSIRKELKLHKKDKISQIYLLEFPILEGPSFGTPYLSIKNNKIIEHRHHGYAFASLAWIRWLDREDYREFIEKIFGVHESGHIHLGNYQPHFIDTPYGLHCRNELCIMSSSTGIIEKDVEKLHRIERLNPDLFCKECIEALYV